MTDIEKAIVFFEEEEDFYLEEGEDERAAHCGRAVIALQEQWERFRKKEIIKSTLSKVSVMVPSKSE